MLCTRLTNARFLTMDPDRPVAHELGIRRGRIVGLDGAVAALPTREVIDLQGATVLPGFIDSHVNIEVVATCVDGRDAGKPQP